MSSICKFYERQAVDLVRLGVFRIDAQGRVWRLAEFSHGGKGRLRPVVPRRADLPHGGTGYLGVNVRLANRMSRTVLAHRLVWQYFHGDILAGLDPNHENGIKKDNRPGNLTLMTLKENHRHAFEVIKTRVNPNGENHPAHKLKAAQILEIRRRSTAGERSKDLALEFSVRPSTISGITTKRRWRHLP